MASIFELSKKQNANSSSLINFFGFSRFATTSFNANFGEKQESVAENQKDTVAFHWTDKERRQHLDLILAMSVESLCTANRSSTGDDRLIHTSLDTLANLIDCQWAQLQLMSDVSLPIEIMNVLHRFVSTNVIIQNFLFLD